MEKDSERRAFVSTGTFFSSVPEQFAAASGDLRHLVKIGFEATSFENGRIGTGFSPQWLLLDLAMIPRVGLDLAKIARDCDLVKEVVTKHPEQVQLLSTALHRAMRNEENLFGELERIVKEIGLTEEIFASKGGGFLWVIALLALAATSCMAHCGHPPVKYPK